MLNKLLFLSLWIYAYFICKSRICCAIYSSCTSFRISLTRNIQSNLDNIVVWNSIYSANVFRSSYFPNTGLAAAKIEALELSIVVIPAFATEIVYYYIA